MLQTGQALARMLAAAGFGAAWTVWGPRPALWGAAAVLLAALAGGRALLPRDPGAPGAVAVESVQSPTSERSTL